MKSPMFIGIAGGTGAGKSTFTEGLLSLFSNSITVISYDNYYKPQDHLPMEERLKTNYDCPDALDTDLLVKHLRELQAGNAVDMPCYDFCNHTRKKELQRLLPAPVMLVDGILTFHDERLRELFDIKIYTDADADERILRRLRRDVRERGRDIDGVIHQYITTVKPMHALYVEPTKKYADIIINGGQNKTALEIVAARIAGRLAEDRNKKT
ncbi:MAG: uridine kinase [Ruminococcaceae bacterium]|nr:uridine kinase [Oscillospiraceae bacterium]